MSGVAIFSGRRIYAECSNHHLLSRHLAGNGIWTRYFSATPTTTNESKEHLPSSARSTFKNIPVNPSILKYIQRVGVGIPQRMTRRQKIKSRFISEQEEKDQLTRTRKVRTSIPPPPFPSSDPKEQQQKSTIRRFPVKLLKSVGDLETEFPKASATMPEVVRPKKCCPRFLEEQIGT